MPVNSYIKMLFFLKNHMYTKGEIWVWVSNFENGGWMNKYKKYLKKFVEAKIIWASWLSPTSIGLMDRVGPEYWGCCSWGLTSILLVGMPLVAVVKADFFTEISSRRRRTSRSTRSRRWKKKVFVNKAFLHFLSNFWYTYLLIFQSGALQILRLP